MSPKNPLLKVGLTALALSGYAPSGVADPPGTAPPGLSATVAPPPALAVLLLTNGRMQRGLVSFDGTNYFLHNKGGKIPFPRRDVERMFATVEEVYQYKRARLPDRDPDESMKLALWCLTNRMTAEAKEQLQVVLAISPKHAQAVAMLDKIEGAEARRALSDPAVVRTTAETIEGQAGAMDPAVLGRMSRQLKVSGLPQIPGLPTPLAVKRANEFGHAVEPVLQAYCARCHNEQYPGDFRLVQTRARRDRTPDALRANLDAVLGLVDRQDPDKSELLSSTLRPHGTGTHKRPVLRGPNDPAYQILRAWVNSLGTPRSPSEVAAARVEARETSGGDGFASDRATAVPLPLTPTPTPALGQRPAPPSAVNPVVPLPPGQFIPGTGAGSPVYAPAGSEFPAPYLLGGPRPGDVPNDAGPPRAKAPVATGNSPPAPPGVTLGATAADATQKPPRKPVKLDPELLQRALMNRFSPQ